MHVLIEPPLTREEAVNKILGVIDSKFFKALAEPVRVELIKVLLLHSPADINTISKHMPQDRSVISKHLQLLLRAGLLNCEKSGRHRFYYLIIKTVSTILIIITTLGAIQHLLLLNSRFGKKFGMLNQTKIILKISMMG